MEGKVSGEECEHGGRNIQDTCISFSVQCVPSAIVRHYFPLKEQLWI